MLENFKQNVNFLSILSIFYFFLMLVRKNDKNIIFREKSCFGRPKCQKNDIFGMCRLCLRGLFWQIFFSYLHLFYVTLGFHMIWYVSKGLFSVYFEKKCFRYPLNPTARVPTGRRNRSKKQLNNVLFSMSTPSPPPPLPPLPMIPQYHRFLIPTYRCH